MKMKPKIVIDFMADVTLSEQEILALDGILGYNVDTFLKVFYEKMGKSYVQPHESGVRSLHENLRKQLSPLVATITEARKRINDALREPPKP